MISLDEVFSIGRFVKPHGVKGEIALNLRNDVFAQGEYPYLICDIDGILVPFFISSFRYKGASTGLVRLDGVDDEKEAHRFDGVEVYLHRSVFKGEEMQGEDYSWNYFMGFTVIDALYGEIGVIEDVDDDTANVLFIINSHERGEILIPAAEDLIEGFDEENRILRTHLPEGLFD
jgi:16S rRNA processing protein RimM